MNCVSKGREKVESNNFSTHGSCYMVESSRSKTFQSAKNFCRTTGQLKRTGEKRSVSGVSFQHDSSRRYTVPPEPPRTAARIGGAHVENLVARDTQVWISHFEYGRHIQCSASDVLENLPYCPSHCKTLDTFRRNHEENRVEPHCGLSGRSSWISYGTFRRREVTLKLSHVEAFRMSEMAIVERVRGLLDTLPCLPPVLGSGEGFDDLNTCHIQQSIGIKLDRKTVLHRIPRAIILDNYLPLISLTTDMELFRAAFARLICFHAILWLRGIEYDDVNVANLMCSEDGIPKLCDYDPSYPGSEEKPSRLANTGTLHFMASELLTSSDMRGKVKKVYRHDVEAFGWVLLWILGRFRDGKQLEQNEGRLFDFWAGLSAVRNMQTQREDAWASISSDKGVQFPQPLSEEFEEDAILFISTLRIAHYDLNSALERLKFPRYPTSRQATEQQVAQFRSVAFVTNAILETSLVANSEYSALVKDALEKENHGQQGDGYL